MKNSLQSLDAIAIRYMEMLESLQGVAARLTGWALKTDCLCCPAEYLMHKECTWLVFHHHLIHAESGGDAVQ